MGRSNRQWRGSKGRGGGRNNGREKRREKEIKFATQEQMQRGYFATYNVVKEAIIADVQKRYKFGTDMAKSVRDGKKFDIKAVKPIREIATLTPSQDRTMKPEEKEARIAQLQKGLDIEYEAAMHMYIERKLLFEENETKAFSLILNNYCTKPMMNRVQDHPKYETEIIDNPVRLMEEIKILMHDTVRAQYPIAFIVEKLAKWLKIVSKEKLCAKITRDDFKRKIVS